MNIILFRRFLKPAVYIFVVIIIIMIIFLNNSETVIVEPISSKTPDPVVIKQETNSPLELAPEVSPEIITLTDGLKIKYLARGDGHTGGTTGDYKISYKMRLSDGKLVKSGSKNVIIQRSVDAWKIAFPTIPVGSKVIIYSDSSHSYGSLGVPGVIPPFEDLIFEIELLSTSSKKTFNKKVLLKTIKIGEGSPLSTNETFKVRANISPFYSNSFISGDKYFLLKIPENTDNNHPYWAVVLDGSTVGSKVKIILPPRFSMPIISKSSPLHGVPMYIDIEILSKGTDLVL